MSGVNEAEITETPHRDKYIGNGIMSELLKNVIAEGKRIREAVEADGGKDRPIDARPGEDERLYLEIDFRDGETNLVNSWGNGTPAWIWEGSGVRFQLQPSLSQLALANLLEEQPELVGAVIAAATGADDEKIGANDALDAALESLGGFIVMDEAEFFGDSPITGRETDAELGALAHVRGDNASGYDRELYLAFSEAEALKWLTGRRNEARDVLDDLDAAA
ncbi:hypothetical protein NKG99_07035 [Mesorhizobium sp. M1409]|uniref:hypothetical protein n=1 Tax=unclassified Mesorhizobium TaxID=325217 RepID=UPI003339545E